ncbi:hypothetical protein JOB18_018831 [Solea senegalensis]|uniref:Uncharacterized protein n=1 Tax=Solea senegalensis TaxID=28829 RepID=A0AAV6STW7_SOLSE|nr:hypothetical protein JOB18_018831 [Solea senegalensis]
MAPENSSSQFQNTAVFLHLSVWPLPAEADKTLTSWPTVIKLGSAAAVAVPGRRHDGSKAEAVLLTVCIFPAAMRPTRTRRP